MTTASKCQECDKNEFQRGYCLDHFIEHRHEWADEPQSDPTMHVYCLKHGGHVAASYAKQTGYRCWHCAMDEYRKRDRQGGAPK